MKKVGYNPANRKKKKEEKNRAKKSRKTDIDMDIY